MIGRVVNNYQIQTLIGEGGQGAVYQAVHPFIGRKAAVKVMRRSFAENDALVARFMNEALAATAIGHPNIIDIIDAGRMDDGLPYLMMEYLDGETLGARLRRVRKLPLGEALAILEQTAAALGAAHAKGIVHRDLKPENLFLAKDSAGPGERLKVLDFGIAKLLREQAPNKLDTDGALFGSPLYMSPEQCRGMASEADARSDVYALGTIAFEMLCGRPPFVADALGDILVMHITQPPPPPRSLTPELPELLASALERALAKDPADRFASMDEFWSALRWSSPWITPMLAQAPDVLPPSPAPALPTGNPRANTPATTARVWRLWSSRRGRPLLLAGAGLAVLGAVLGGVLAFVALRTPPGTAQRPPAVPASTAVERAPATALPAGAESGPGDRGSKRPEKTRPTRPLTTEPPPAITKW